MKKKIFAGAMLMLCSSLAVAGCNAKPNKQGEFSQKEYILSVDESLNFLGELKFKGLQKKDISLKSSSPQVVDRADEGIFVAKSSGSAIIEAQIEGKTVASCKVVVKYKMASPKNFKISSNGLLTWDKSSVAIEGENVYADEYIISYKQNTRQGEGESITRTTTNNQFQFEDFGSYTVEVWAKMKDENQKGKFVDTREAKKEYSFVYGNTSEIENITINHSEDYEEEKVTLVWNEVANGVYDIYLNGICISSDLEDESFELDYSSSSRTKIDEGGQIEVKIVAKDKDGLLNPSQITKTISRLKKPSITYVNDALDKSNGHISVVKQSEECVYIIMDKDGKEIERSSTLSPTLEGFAEGIYKIRAYAKGGENQLNSSPTQTIIFGVLASPEFDVEISGKQANITFEGREYVNRYKISVDGNQSIISLADGVNTYSLDLEPFNLPAGDHTIKITPLPSLDGDEIKPMSMDGETTSNILSSNAGEHTFKVLSEFGTVTHRIENEINQFKFEKIEGATGYIIEVNDEVLGENKFTLDNSGDKTIISIPNLKNIDPNSQNEYLFKFTAVSKDGSKQTGISSQTTKTLKILGLASGSESQTNGSYTFNKVSQSNTYYYEIYSTGKDYALASGAIPLCSKTIYSGNKTTDALSGGYYKIRIYTKSTDIDNYLDADFADPSRYFEANFSVTQKLETPSITFDRESNSLNIQRVQFGGGYEIYVDGILNGTLDLADDNMEGVYIFSANTFKNAKTYSVTVRATGGTKYGDELYENSSFASLTITKLAPPTFTVSENFDDLGKKTGETLTVSDSQNPKSMVKRVEYYINGERLDDNNYSIEFYRPESGNTFDFAVKYIARDEGLNAYYIDSEECQKSFKRIDAPRDIEYNNGSITFTGTSEAIDYYATLYVIKGDNVAYCRGLSLGITSTTIDLQGRLNLLMQSYPAFASILDNADRLEIELYAKANDPSGENYLLHSYNGYTSSGTQRLVIRKLSSSNLSFDKQNLTLSWTGVEEGSTYDIYANGNVVLAGLTSLSTTLNNGSLSRLDYLSGFTLKVKSNNGRYLGSKFSNEIYIKKLSPASEMTISAEGEGTIILTDYSNTSKVLNGSTEMDYSVGGTSVTKTLSGNETLKIRFIGKDSGNRYYLDSDEGVFNVETFAKPVISKEGDVISWQDLSAGQSGLNENAIIYTLVVSNGSDSYEYKTTSNHINISALEASIGVSLEKGITKIRVKVGISHSYSLSHGGKGYYGENQSDELTITKLDVVTPQAEVIYGDEGNAFERRSNSKIKIEFADKWQDMANVKFKINKFLSAGGSFISASQSEIVLGGGDVTSIMSLVKSGSGYVLTIDQSYFTSSGKYKLEFSVTSEGYIESDKSSVEITRLSQISNISVTDSGVATLIDTNNFSGTLPKVNGDLKHLVMLSIGGKSEVKQVEKDANFNLSDFTIWEGEFGEYSLQGICYDANNKIIPSNQVFSLSGTKIQGIESLKAENDGNIVVVVSDSTNIAFKGKIEGVEKTIPFVATENNNEFSISILSLANLFELEVEGTYNLELTVRKIGSVDADWKSVNFAIGKQDNFMLVKDKDNIKTYLVIQKNDDLTEKFRLNIGGVVKIIPKSGVPFLLPIKEGYVNYALEDGAKVDLTYSQSRGDNYFLCYAMELDKCLDFFDIDYGDFTFNISRISKESGVIKQHNEQKISIARLNTIQTEVSDGEYLQIKNSMLRFGFENKTSKPNLITKYLINFESENSSIQKIISTKSLDLRTVGLVEGEEYTISVQVLCDEESVISSKSAGELKTVQYTTPASLEVLKGSLVFNESQFKEGAFAKKIISYAKGDITEQELADFLDQTLFKSPYYFASNGDFIGIGEGMGELKIVKLNEGSLTGEEYIVSVSLVDLIPNIEIPQSSIAGAETLFGVLEHFKNSSLSTKTSGVVSLLNSLTNANKGVGLNKILFDDIGREIPTGDYRVLIRHKGGNSGNVDSSYSSPSNIKINPAPAIDLVFDEENNRYLANIAPQGGLNNYILQIRQNVGLNSTVYPPVYISLNSNNQYIALCEGKDVSGALADYESGFGIVLNKLKTVLIEKDIITLPAETELVCDVFANNETSLSKSGKFTLCYRELDGRNISFVDGNLAIKNHANTKKVLLRYQQQGLTAEQTIIEGEVALPAVGKYDYIVLSYPGEIIANNVYIESQRYLIKNIYQLNAPNVITANNQFNIGASPADTAFVADITLRITNNMADGKFFNIENLGENFAQNGLYYEVGDPKRGETSRATSYTFNFEGNDASLQLESCIGSDRDMAEFLLAHAGTETLVFSSADSTINAKMLTKVELSLNEGNVTWTSCSDQIDGTILYEVKIEFFSTSSPDTDNTPKKKQTLYTTGTSLPTDTFDDTLETYNYTKYLITVTPVAGQPLGSVGGDSVQTIEGDYYSISRVSTYQNASAVLKGESVSKEITRSNAVEDAKIKDGKIVFKLKEKEFIITAKREGKTFRLLGESEFNETTQEVMFTPNTGETNGGFEEGKEYEISIYTYNSTTEESSGTLLSKPVSLKKVFKLPEITEDRFKITFVKEGSGYLTMLDLSKFFENKVDGDNACYEVVVVYKTQNSQTPVDATLSLTNPRIAIDTWTSLEMIAKASSSTGKNLINSRVQQFSINPTSIKNAYGVFQLDISFDDIVQRFNWHWIDNRKGEFEYFVELTYADETTENAIVKDNYYAPIKMGKITTFKISARQIIDSQNRCTFSEIYSIGNNSNFVVNMFQSGEGTQSNPYIISTKQEFLNIANRNDGNNKVYFKLANSLSGLEIRQSELVKSGGFLIDTFNGVLDGNGKTITFICDQTAKKTLTIKTNSSSTYEFGDGCAIFGEISSNGEVKNLTIKTSLEFATPPLSCVVAPVALINSGRIENVNVQGLTTGENNVLTKSNWLFIGGLVGINRGEISSCENRSELNVRFDISAFGYGGIALVNEKTIEKCNSINSKTLTFGVETTAFIGGIALSNSTNQSAIRLCKVESSFSVSMVKNSITYAGGIVSSQSSGTINACIFNGQFIKASNGTLTAGGIVYSATGGSVNNCVSTQADFSGVKIDATIRNCYGTSAYNSITALDSKANILSGDTGFDGVVLKISFKVALQKWVAELSY